MEYIFINEENRKEVTDFIVEHWLSAEWSSVVLLLT